MHEAHAPLLLAAALLAAFALSSPGATPHADGKDKPAEFSDIVRLIETHFRVKHKGLPTLAKLPLKVAGRFRRFAEVGSLKLAVFDDQDFSATADTGGFAARLRDRLEPAWQPLVEVRSGQEQTHIYAADTQRLVKVLVVQINRRDAVALQVSVTPENLGRLLRDPEAMGDAIIDETTSSEP